MASFFEEAAVSDLERKLQTQEVLEEEDFATLIIRSTIDGIYTYDRDLKITLWNPAMERITGLKKEKVLGRKLFEAFPFLVKSGFQNLILEALKGNTSEEAEIPYDIPETGRKGYCRRLSCPLRNEEGEVVGGLTIVHDSTEHKRARDEVLYRRRAEERLRFLSEAGMLLSGTLDYQKVLDLIIGLTSEHFSAWAKLRLLEEDGSIRVIHGHKNPEIAKYMVEIEAKYPPTEELKEGPLWVLRNGGQQYFPNVTREMVLAYTKGDPVHAALLKDMKSYICVPIQAGGKIFGTFSLLGTERAFTDEDLSLAYDLARWIAVAIGNARLYGSAKSGETK
jgi:PAS domain S-box-containing protein